MNKAILVVNEPDTCRNCILWHREYYGHDLYTDYCAGIPMVQIHDIDIYYEKPDWCPLISYNKFIDNIITNNYIDNYHSVGSYAFTYKDKEADFSGLSDD